MLENRGEITGVYNEKWTEREREREGKEEGRKDIFQRYAELRPHSGVTDETREGKTHQEVDWK